MIIIAGFGRFGQTVMEELEAIAEAEIERMYVLDIDANRRLLVAEEQQRISGNYERVVLQGDISHPDVWRRLCGDGGPGQQGADHPARHRQR